jgi:hypothetical protein
MDRVMAARATEAIKAKALGHTGQFRIKVQKVVATQNYGDRFLLLSPPSHAQALGHHFDYVIFTTFAVDQAEAVAKLRPNSTLTIAGAIVRTDLAAPGEDERLIVDVKNCRIVPGDGK